MSWKSFLSGLRTLLFGLLAVSLCCYGFVACSSLPSATLSDSGETKTPSDDGGPGGTKDIASDAGDGSDLPPTTVEPDMRSIPESNQVGLNAPTGFSTGLNQRSCPRGGGEFIGSVCGLSSSHNSCSSNGCIPKSIPRKTVSAGGNFWSRCLKESVLCVRPGTSLSTLSQAAAMVSKDKGIQTILVASGTYRESVFFENITQNLVIEGESNGEKGTRVVAPASKSPNDTEYAALKFSKVGNVTISRMRLSGGGHGLFVKDFVSVTINNNHFTANMLSGVSISGSGKVVLQKNVVSLNGGVSGAGGVGLLGVTINNNHRGNPLQSLFVTINNNHRVVGKTGSLVTNRLRFGVELQGPSNVTLEDNLIVANGAGGVIANANPVSVTINNNHRIPTKDDVAVTINNNHRVVMKGNRIANNGPMGRNFYAASKSPQTCKGGQVSERGFCYPKPLSVEMTIKDGKPVVDKVTALGVGAVVSGAGKVEIAGNSFYGNDALGLVVHSANEVTLQSNAIERNGVRQGADLAKIEHAYWVGASIWNVQNKLSIQGNLVTDHLTDGLLVSHRPNKSASSTLTFTMTGNHLSGTGRFLPAGRNGFGNGIRLMAFQNQFPVTMNVSNNYFASNRRVGFSGHGFLIGNVETNWMRSHPFRAMLFHDTSDEPSANHVINVKNNVIDGGSGYGLQIHTGRTNFVIRDNVIANINRVGTTGSIVQEGDALNITDVKGTVSIINNRFMSSQRTAMFFENTDFMIEGNKYEKCQYDMVMKGQCEATKGPKGDDAKGLGADNTRAAEWNNRKDF